MEPIKEDLVLTRETDEEPKMLWTNSAEETRLAQYEGSAVVNAEERPRPPRQVGRVKRSQSKTGPRLQRRTHQGVEILAEGSAG